MLLKDCDNTLVNTQQAQLHLSCFLEQICISGLSQMQEKAIILFYFNFL